MDLEIEGDQGSKTGGVASAFPRTRWTLVLAAGAGEEVDREAALGELCRQYWYPLYAYARRRGLSAEDAQDATQSFFEHLLSAQVFERVGGKELGRLRSYLLTSMQRWLMKEHRKMSALKRGGGVGDICLNEEEGEQRYLREMTHEETPEALFERRWALDIIEQALTMLKADYERSGKGALHAALCPWLTRTTDQGELSRLAESLGLTPGHVRVQLHRLKKHFRAVLWDLVAATVATEDEVAEEMRHLQAVLTR
ncbi:MAG: sigma-70 family RNA polymerase sigma factor [Verrucomicrobiales bacterium]|nr:sigma-70 family RNA polymerase sigma factor [Verrucomicrobiales bacterium]MCP5558633.1 sigma-70 family RNA polymerase sigma factor [Verrucomicrobiaceae bacterium]